LELAGQREAADELRDGYPCLNGLTDGWAGFFESVERVQATRSAAFGREDRRALKAIRTAARKAVWRR